MRLSTTALSWLSLCALLWAPLAACKQANDRANDRGSSAGSAVERPREQPRPARAPISIIDGLGLRVTLARPARRIASLSPSNSEIVAAVGCGARVVLRDRASDYPPPIKRLPATDPFHLSPTHVAGYRPDLVLLSHADAARTTILRRIGLHVASFDPKTLSQVWQSVLDIGALCGNAVRGRELVVALRQRVAAVERRVRGRPRPRVYIEIDGSDPARPWVAGAGSFVDDLVRRAGGRNALRTLSRAYAQVSAEAVALSKPDVVLVAVAAGHEGMMRARLVRRPGWSKMAAIAAGRIIDSIARSKLSRPGPRLVEGLEALARALHPRAFVAASAPVGAGSAASGRSPR